MIVSEIGLTLNFIDSVTMFFSMGDCEISLLIFNHSCAHINAIILIIYWFIILFWSCGARQSGNLDSTNEEALDGIIGFGKSNSSMISQLASSGGVRKMFAHCLDGINGGGIFAIGHVVQPEVNKTPLVPNQ